MKTIIAIALLVALALPSFARDTSVRGYVRKDGTYVQPHMRSAPNNTTFDNFSTRGNVNPYTGQPGDRDPSPTISPPRMPSSGLEPIQPMRPYEPFSTQRRSPGLSDTD